MPSSHSFASIINKARQNRILPSVTYKMRRAHFPVRAERVNFRAKGKFAQIYTLREKKGEPILKQIEYLRMKGFSLKDVSAKCFAHDKLCLPHSLSQNTFIRRLSEAPYARCPRGRNECMKKLKTAKSCRLYIFELTVSAYCISTSKRESIATSATSEVVFRWRYTSRYLNTRCISSWSNSAAKAR